MPDYTVRVELEGSPTREEYADLHERMKKLGFQQTVKGTSEEKNVVVQLPTGLYYGTSEDQTSIVAFECVQSSNGSANSSWCLCSKDRDVVESAVTPRSHHIRCDKRGDAPKEPRIPVLRTLALFECFISFPYRVRIGRRPVLPCGAVQRRRPADRALWGHSVAAAGRRSSGRYPVRAAGSDLASQPLKPPWGCSLPLWLGSFGYLEVATDTSKPLCCITLRGRVDHEILVSGRKAS